MLKVRIEAIVPGMILGKSIYSATGNILLAAGKVLDERYIRRLLEFGIPAIFIKDSRFNDIEQPPEVVSELTRIQSQSEVKKAFDQIELKGKINLGASRVIVNKLLEEILANRHVLVSLNDIRKYDEEVFGHSVSVCILSVVIGLKLNYNQLQLRDLGIGSLLHDLGKACINKTILNKQQQLTPQEFNGIKEHSLLGFEILRNREEIDILSAHVALQHHEKFNGSGYPRGLRGTEIHEYARITAIADVYDAMTSDRIYRPAYDPMTALQILQESAGSHLDLNMVKLFIKTVSLYPVGAIVVLNSGEVGVVVISRPEASERPVVRIILDSHRNQLDRLYEIDLKINK
ncbi:MAG: HD-GYP domain-containing protein, partial [Carboxydocellales bacterium]